ncbi:MAG: hypothetical protein Kow0068_01900 [Marinilabiliales bacterium]
MDTCNASQSICKNTNIRESIIIYPNPAKDEINILLPDIERNNVFVAILHVDGSKIFEKKYKITESQFMITDFKAK